MSQRMNWFASMAMAVFCAQGAWSDVVSAWDFNLLTGTVPATIAADTGHGGLSLVEFTSGLSSTSGTDVNAVSGVVAGQSLSVAGLSQNNRSIVVDVDTLGMQHLQFSVAARRSATGFAGMLVQVWNGLAWVDAGSISASTTQWQQYSVDLSAYTFADNGSLRLRLLLSGATSSGGNVRLDNLRVDGSAVPAPGVIAVAGAAAAGARRGARNNKDADKEIDKHDSANQAAEPAKSRSKKPVKKSGKDPQ